MSVINESLRHSTRRSQQMYLSDNEVPSGNRLLKAATSDSQYSKTSFFSPDVHGPPVVT